MEKPLPIWYTFLSVVNGRREAQTQKLLRRFIYRSGRRDTNDWHLPTNIQPSMNQKLLVRRDEIARTYQLGTLIAQYPSRFSHRFGGWWGLAGFVFLPTIFISMLILLSKTLPALATTLGSIVGIIWITLALIWIASVIPYPFKRKDVYLYEHGFLCLRGHSVQVARWEQISSVQEVRYHGRTLLALKVHLNDKTRIMIPNTVDHFGELQTALDRSFKRIDRANQ